MLSFIQACPAEIVIRNSRFLAELLPVDSAEAAREILRQQKLRHSGSSHLVHAFIVGPGANIMGCSDDGEPPGTAGRPSLEVLKGSGITDLILTTARWFGGTKLGTGGLVKAYTMAAQEVIAGAVTRELVSWSRISLSLPYAIYQPSLKILSELSFVSEHEEFAAEIQIQGKLRSADVPALQEQLGDLSRGKCRLAILDKPMTE